MAKEDLLPSLGESEVPLGLKPELPLEITPPQPVENYLLYSIWFLAGISLLSLILSKELGLATVLSIVLIFPFLFFLDKEKRLKKIVWLENLLVLFFFIFSLFRFFYFKNNFLIVVAEFLISFLIVKLAFKKERKDFLQIVILSIFVFLSAATLATDFSFIFSFLLFTIALSTALSFIALTEEKDEKYCLLDSEQSLNKKVLFQYFFGNAWITLVLTVIFSIFIFIFFPRLSLAVFQGAFLAPARKSGISNSVNLAGSSKIFEDTTVAMRVEIPSVEFSKITPVSEKKRLRVKPLYLRGQTLAHFDGVRWTEGEKKSRLLVADTFRSRVWNAQKVLRNRFQILDEENKLRLKKKFSMKLGEESYLLQKIYLESLEGAPLFGAAWIEEIYVKSPQLLLGEDGSVIRPANFSGRTFYEVRSLVERPEEKILGSKLTLPHSFHSYLQIPEIDYSKIESLVKKIVSPKDSAYLRAKKIEKFLREGAFQYTLDNPVKTSSNPTETFLFETKKGHCEYFASAMALMLRLAGIPSRVVSGFLACEWNEEGGYFVVRLKDAHAWVEAYVGENLWLEFDPSPPQGKDLSEENLWALWKSKLDYLNFLWNAYVLSYDLESQKNLARNVELKSVQFSRELDRLFAKVSRYFKIRGEIRFGKMEEIKENQENEKKITFYLLLLIFVLLSLWLSRKLNYYFKIKMRGKREELNLNFYRKMLRLLSKKGFKKISSETPLEFANRVILELTQLKKDKDELFKVIYELTNLFCKFRYSGYKPNASELTEANHSLTNLKRYL